VLENKTETFKKIQKKTILKFYEVLDLPVSLYNSDSWTVTRQQNRRNEVRFLRAVVDYYLVDKKRNEDKTGLTLPSLLPAVNKY
jgi:hypothetical protein